MTFSAPVAVSAIYPRATIYGTTGSWDAGQVSSLTGASADDRRCIIACGPMAAPSAPGWSLRTAPDLATACGEAWSAITSGSFGTMLLVGCPDDPGGLLLCSQARALASAEPPAAWFRGACTTGSGIEAVIDAALDAAGLRVSAIGALDVPDGSTGRRAMRHLAATRGPAPAPLWTRARDAAAAGSFAAFARIVEALRCGHVFASTPAPADAPAAGLAFAAQPMPWLRPSAGRHALLVLGESGFILSEHRASTRIRLSSRMVEHEATLIPLTATEPADLDADLAALSDALAGGEPYKEAARRLRGSAAASSSAPYAAALVVRSQAEAEREVQMLRRGLQSAATVVKTPAGSVATRAPLRSGGIVFVYPGAGSAYPGLGRDLCALFPGLAHRAERHQSSDATWFAEAAELYPPTLTDLDPEALATFEATLAVRHATLFAGTVLHSLTLTTLARDVLGLRPDAAMGYCIGEVAMIAATGLWGDLETLHRRQATSPALNQRVYGRMQAVRECWGLGPDDPSIAGTWQSHVVFASREAVSRAVAPEARAYLTIVNTPSQTVIAGDGPACARVLERLGCASIPLHFNTPGHSPAIASERALMAGLHHLPVTPDPTITFHAQIGSPLPQDADSVAAAIAHTYTNPVDFPGLVETAYAQGGRVFLELGARPMCSTWIAESLSGRPHLAIPFDIRGVDPALAILRAVAHLVAHRIPVDLGRLFQDR